MKRIDRVLEFAFDQKEIVKAAKVGQALRRWDEIVGEELARRSWPDRYEAGTVYVAAAGSAWSQELRMKKTVIMDRIAQMLGSRALVADVRFGVRKLPARPESVPLPPKAVVVMDTHNSPHTFTIPKPEIQDPEVEIKNLQTEVDEVRDIVQRILARAKEDA